MSKARTRAFQKALLENVGKKAEITIQIKIRGSISGITTLCSKNKPTITIRTRSRTITEAIESIVDFKIKE